MAIVAGGGDNRITLFDPRAASTIVADGNATIQAPSGNVAVTVTGVGQTNGFNSLLLYSTDSALLGGSNVVGVASVTGGVSLAGGSVNFIATNGSASA